jgi:pantoate--beta-alanine ligase
MQGLALRWRRGGRRVALVPTMGCLHAGHVSLIRRARIRVGRQGRVVVSIYVNPTQFGSGEDLTRYPRDLARDRRLCRAAGADVVFAPSDKEIYFRGSDCETSTYVVESRLSQGMEGASRPGHFQGVTTVVAILLQLVLPELAVFGAKDYQQAAVVGRMVRDLHMPVRVEVAPTVREKDGLALSSRNQYLSPAEREQAVVLWNVIQYARRRVREGRGAVSTERLKAELGLRVGEYPAARLDYVAFFHGGTLEPVAEVRRGAHLALAVWVGKTRLIDNGRL